MVSFVFIAIIMLAGLIAYKHEKKLADTLGIVCCGCILVLYVFAFFGRLYWIDYVGILVTCLTLFKIVFDGELRGWCKSMATIQNGCILLFVILLSISQADRAFDLSAEAGYWASDIKYVFLKNGFAGRLGNPVPEYGLNPPAITMFKWLFMHIMPGELKAGLGYSGYVCLNFILLLPFISRISEIFERRDFLEGYRKNVGVKVAQNNKYRYDEKKLISKYKVRVSGKLEGYEAPVRAEDVCKELLINVAGCVLVAVVALMLNAVCTKQAGPDVTMAIVYGLLLWTIWNRDTEHKTLYYCKLGILGSVLVLCRITGILLAVSALALIIVCFRIEHRNERFNVVSIYETDLLYAIYSVVSWMVFLGSWIGLCIVNVRQADVNINYRMILKGHLASHLLLYLKEIALMPIHGNEAYRFGLSFVGIIIVSLALLWGLENKNVIDREERNVISVFAIVTVAIINIVLFWYSFAKASSIGDNMESFILIALLPLGTGLLLLIFGVWIDNVAPQVSIRPAEDKSVRDFENDITLKKIRILYLAMGIVVLSVCDLTGMAREIWGYRNAVSEIETGRKEAVSEASMFVDTIKKDSFFEGKRVLYICDSNTEIIDYSGDISYECIPVSVVYANVSKETEYNEVAKLIYESKAQYVYMDDIEGLSEDMSLLVGEEFQSGRLYTVNGDGTISRYYENIDRELVQ